MGIQFKKKIFAACMMALTMVGTSVFPASAEEAVEENGEVAAEAVADSDSELKVYLYENEKYGYTMLCPYQPEGIIPASMIYEGKKGDILVFSSSSDDNGYAIHHAWVILVDAFDDKAVPDLNKISEQEAESYLEKLMHSNGYEGISLVNLTENNKGIFAVTAKEVEIDTDGDGEFDVTATAETQEAVAFFRTEKGRCFAMHLIDNPELRKESIALFQFGVSSVQDLDKDAKK